VRREAEAVVLFLLGIAIGYAGITNLYLRYVRAGLRPLLLAAGVVLIITALATAWYELRRPAQQNRPEQEHGDRHHHDREHRDHREPRVAWLLVLPLLALAMVVPPPLGSYAAQHAGTVLQQPGGFPPLPTADPLPLELVDYAARAVYDHGHSLGTRRIQATGFITLDRNGAFYLTRMVINCCAADAQPVKVALTGQAPRVLQPDSWLEVIGTFTSRQAKDPDNGGIVPYINVNQSKRVPPPANPYEG
jgi:putative membrane protein